MRPTRVRHTGQARCRFGRGVELPGRPARVLIGSLVSEPELRARWLDYRRTIKEALAPVIRERAHGDLDEDQARCTAAVIVTAQRRPRSCPAIPAALRPWTFRRWSCSADGPR